MVSGANSGRAEPRRSGHPDVGEGDLGLLAGHVHGFEPGSRHPWSIGRHDVEVDGTVLAARRDQQRVGGVAIEHVGLCSGQHDGVSVRSGAKFDAGGIPPARRAPQWQPWRGARP